LHRIAGDEGKPLTVTEEEEDEKEEEENVDEAIADFIRFFHHHDDKELALFVECGLDRVIKVNVHPDHLNLELKISIPPPPDELISSAKLKHSFANEITLKDTSRTFIISSPGMLKPKQKEVIYFPDEETTTWVIFKFKFESLVEEESIEVKVKMTPKKNLK
jgi:hypothetical protein